jgi:hypothetical protein
MDGERFEFGPVPVRPPGGEPGQHRTRSTRAGSRLVRFTPPRGLRAISTATRRAAGSDGGRHRGRIASTFSPCPGSARPWCTCYSVRLATTPSRRARRSHLTHGHGSMTRRLPRSPSPRGPLVALRLSAPVRWLETTTTPLWVRPSGRSGSGRQAGLDAAGRRPLRFFSHGTFVAPSGTSPCSRYFHSAINSSRANATIPTFRDRALPEPKRR